MIKDGTTRAKPSIWSQRTTRNWAVSSALWGPMRSGWGRQATAPRWGFTWASFSAGSLSSAGGQRLDFLQCSSLDPISGVVFGLVWFGFLLNRVFNLEIAPWPWKMENTVVDSARHFCGQPLPSLCHSFRPRLLPAISPHETVLLLGVLRVWFTYVFSFCLYFVLFFKPPLSLKGHLSLLIIFRSFCHEEEQEGIHSAVRFHAFSLISGPRTYFTCWTQFTICPEAWGRGPSRRRLVLLALSLLGEINAWCNIWRMPSTPQAERQKNMPGSLRALK